MKSGSSDVWPPFWSSSRAFQISLMLFSVSRLLRCLFRIYGAAVIGRIRTVQHTLSTGHSEFLIWLWSLVQPRYHGTFA